MRGVKSISERAVAQRDVRLEMVERRGEVQHVTAQRTVVLDQHVPAVFGRDLAQEVVVAGRWPACGSPSARRPDRWPRNASTPPSRIDSASADWIEDRQHQVLEADDARGHRIGQRHVAPGRNRDREPAQPCCPPCICGAGRARSPKASAHRPTGKLAPRATISPTNTCVSWSGA